jgi:hypothetical protein
MHYLLQMQALDSELTWRWDLKIWRPNFGQTIITNANCSWDIRFRQCLVTFTHESRLTNSMEQRPSASQAEVHYRIHRSLPPFPILSEINPVQASRPTSSSSILILSSHIAYVFQVVSFLLFFHQNPVCISTIPHRCCIPCPYRSWFDHLNNIQPGVYSISLLLYSRLHSTVTSSLLHPNLFLFYLVPWVNPEPSWSSSTSGQREITLYLIPQTLEGNTSSCWNVIES